MKNGAIVQDLICVILNCWVRMGSLKRKIAREKSKRAKKEIKQQLTMFEKIGDECTMCKRSFDKKSKEHTSTWNVVVREKEKIVRLYCPECWDEAIKIIKEIENDIRIQSERGIKSTNPSQSE